MPDHVPDPRSLRVSDAEREHVVELLQRATGAGLLDLDEFTRRVDAALAARTRGELNVVLLDLPGMAHPEQPAATGTPHRSPVRPQSTSDAVITSGSTELRSVLGSLTRRGDWDVPARLVVRTKVGSTELDFTKARIPHDVVEIELDVVAGSVEMRMPHGARVEHHEVQSVLSSIEDKRRAGSDGTPGPTFRLTGSVRAGSVEIRSPKRRWWHGDE
ncbi:DUF1707 SHOCT-like domain-containing protein [Pseudonocardia xinjiangensis]|uniref:DUF1707 SHOCT-like domain-containing protein n=1 Tax=Pseudonocardia xinjiangensis TaxID=75289 RepID=UPI003D8DF92D